MRNTSSQPKIPVLVLTGFLGSGKTTLLNKLIKGDTTKRLAIIENEYGEVSVDHFLIERSQEVVIEIRNGCLCCNVRGDLIEALKTLAAQREQFDRIVIETTGLADPGPITQTFGADPFAKENYRVEAVISLIDSKHALTNWTQEIQAQVAHADILVLTKTDLVAPEEAAKLTKHLEALNPTAKQFDARKQPDQVLEALKNPAPLKSQFRMITEKASEKHAHTKTHTELYDAKTPLDRGHFETFLQIFIRIWGNEIFRLKGVVWFKGEDAPSLLQVVQHQFEITPLKTAPPGAPMHSQFVLIASSDEMTNLLRNGIETCARESRPQAGM